MINSITVYASEEVLITIRELAVKAGAVILTSYMPENKIGDKKSTVLRTYKK